MKKSYLKATLQKSYYKKAIVKNENGNIILQSYNTDVVMIDKNNNIIRLWNGWSSTTAKHINDFLIQNGFNKLSKKEWLKMPCINSDMVYNIHISNGFFDYKCPALLTLKEVETEVERVYKNNKNRVVWYE